MYQNRRAVLKERNTSVVSQSTKLLISAGLDVRCPRIKAAIRLEQLPDRGAGGLNYVAIIARMDDLVRLQTG
jgi:hypothetical protein